VPFILEDLANVTFDKPSFGKRGYRESEVDSFVDRVARTLQALRDGVATPADDVTPVDVHHVTFHKSGFGERGYDEQQVDDLLDEVELELDRLSDEAADAPEPTALRPRVAGGIGPDQVRSVEFHRAPFGKRGYDEEEVDLFLDRIEATLRGKDTISAHDIEGVLFSKPPIGKRGYNEIQVDEFLDQVEATLALREAS
jgi:DivIVA domain-containing protein